MKRLALLPLVFPLAATSALGADVLVVDASAGPGSQFTNLNTALAHAADGDILLVKGGVYPGFSSAGKAVAITADAGATVRFSSAVAITQVPAHGVFTLRGVEFHATADLELTDNQGLVRLEDLDLSGGEAAFGAAFATSNVRIQNSRAVRMARVVLGYDGPNPQTEPSSAAGMAQQPEPALLAIQGSEVHILDSRIQGSPGRDAFSDPLSLLWVFGEPGGNGIEFDATSPVRIASSEIVGGPGGDGTASAAFGCVGPRAGGNAILAKGGGLHELVLHGCTTLGGEGGAMVDFGLPFGCPAKAQSGVGVAQNPTALLAAGVTDRQLPALWISPVVREADPLAATYLGLPGDQAYLLVSLRANASPAPVPGALTWLELGGSPALFALGTADGAGQANWMLPAFGPVLEPGTGIVFYLQTLGVRAGGDFEFGAFATTALIDA